MSSELQLKGEEWRFLISALPTELAGVRLRNFYLFFPAGNLSEEQVGKDTAMQHPAA